MNTPISKKRIAVACDKIAAVCRLAWQANIMRGFSGNASIRINEKNAIVITASGVAKGRLTKRDFIVVRGGKQMAGRKPSLELALHQALYDNLSEANAILHTHPVWLQTLSLLEPQAGLLNLDLTESDYWRERLVVAPEYPPGSPELGPAAVRAVRKRWPENSPVLLPCAVWLSGHGLCAIGENIEDCLGISEQLEHLAHIQWAFLACASA